MARHVDLSLKICENRELRNASFSMDMIFRDVTL